MKYILNIDLIEKVCLSMKMPQEIPRKILWHKKVGTTRTKVRTLKKNFFFFFFIWKFFFFFSFRNFFLGSSSSNTPRGFFPHNNNYLNNNNNNNLINNNNINSNNRDNDSSRSGSVGSPVSTRWGIRESRKKKIFFREIFFFF
jgi:hypothetical protein